MRRGVADGLSKWAEESGASLEALGDPVAIARDLAAAFRASPLEVASQLALGDWVTLYGDLTQVGDAANAKRAVYRAGFATGHSGPEIAAALIGALSNGKIVERHRSYDTIHRIG